MICWKLSLCVIKLIRVAEYGKALVVITYQNFILTTPYSFGSVWLLDGTDPKNFISHMESLILFIASKFQYLYLAITLRNKEHDLKGYGITTWKHFEYARNVKYALSHPK